MLDSPSTRDKNSDSEAGLVELTLPATESDQDPTPSLPRPALRKAEATAAAQKPAPVPQVAAPRKRVPVKQVLLIVLGLVAAAAGVRYGWHWWTVGRFEETTDDAFLQADKVTVAPKVGGFVADVLVTDNQPVKAGDIIARIDASDYQIVLAQDEAELEKSKATLEGVAAALIQQQARIVEAKADVANTTAALSFSSVEDKRYTDLMSHGAGTTQRAQQASTDLQMKQAAFDKANASYDAAQKQIDALQSLEAAARASLRRAEINLQQAQLNIGYTVIKARSTGSSAIVRCARANWFSRAPIFSPSFPWARRSTSSPISRRRRRGRWKKACRRNSPSTLWGTMSSTAVSIVSRLATGSQFALLPPENATGNFTKIVQRVPVKITLDGNDPMISKLRPGLSAEATIDTQDEPERELPAPKNMMGALDRDGPLR